MSLLQTHFVSLYFPHLNVYFHCLQLCTLDCSDHTMVIEQVLHRPFQNGAATADHSVLSFAHGVVPRPSVLC